MPNLCPCIDDATNETNNDGRYTAKCDGRCKEYEAADGNGQLVECSNHRVGRRGCDTNAPGRAVGDEDCGKTRIDHPDNQAVSGFDGEVLFNITTGPILEDERASEEHGDSQEIVVEHS